jgi:DNA-binding MarR family transcriptional regulator
MPSATHTAIDTDTPARLRAAVARLNRRLRESAPSTGLTQTELSVLFSAGRLGPIGMSDLARLEDLNPTMLSRVVARLADRGLLVRCADPDDGRAVVVRTTAEGTALRDRLRRARTDALARELDVLAPSEAAALEAALPVLESLVARLQAGPA